MMHDKTNIKKCAERLIRCCGSDNPNAAADFLGITVVRADLGGALGQYVSYCRQRYIIIDENAPVPLIDFVCAHEIGHALLDGYENTQRLTAYTRSCALTNVVERRANEFAVNFLLNESYLREHHDVSIGDLAACRGVPTKYLNLLRY